MQEKKKYREIYWSREREVYRKVALFFFLSLTKNWMEEFTKLWFPWGISWKSLWKISLSLSRLLLRERWKSPAISYVRIIVPSRAHTVVIDMSFSLLLVTIQKSNKMSRECLTNTPICAHREIYIYTSLFYSTYIPFDRINPKTFLSVSIKTDSKLQRRR